MKSIKLYFLACICMGLFSAVCAQSLTPQVVNAVGATMTQSSGSLHFTVGDLVVDSQTDDQGNSLGGGFVNSATSSTVIVSVEQTEEQLWAIALYPNPTSDHITLNWERDLNGDVNLLLTDLQGRKFMSRNYPGTMKTLVIDTSDLPAGTYLLQLMHKDTDSHATIRFIKTNR